MLTSTRPRLFYSDRGTGEPVLLITGWTISSAVFDPVADLYLPHLRVIAYDHRGTGRSGRWDGPVSMAMLAADAARVLDELAVDAAHVVGLSLGAAVAIELGVRMPQRVKSLVIVGGGAGGPASAAPPLGAAARSLLAAAGDSARRRRLWPAAVLFSEAFRARHRAEVEEYLPYFGRFRAAPWVGGWQALAVACYGRRGSLGRVGAPTLVVHGEEDVMVGVENARRLAEAIAGAELWVAEGCGHAVPLERAEETARLLVGWVERHSRREPPAASSGAERAERLTRPFSLAAGTVRNVGELGRLFGR